MSGVPPAALSRWARARAAAARLRGLLWPQRRLALAAALAMIGATVCALAVPWILQIVLDGVLARQRDRGLLPLLRQWLPTETSQLLASAAVAFLVLTAAKGLFTYVQNLAAATVGQRVVTQLRLSVFERMLRLSPIFHAQRRSGDLLLRLTGDISMLREVMLPSLLEATRQLLQIVGALVGMLLIDPLMTAVAVAVLPVLSLTTIRFGGRIRQVVREQRRKEGKLATTAAEALHSLVVVQAYARAEAIKQRLARQSERSLGAGLRSLRLEESMARTVELTLALGVCAALSLGGWRALHGVISAGELVVFLTYLRSLDKPVSSLVRLSAKINKGIASAERVFEVLDANEEVEESPAAIAVSAPRGEIVFENVTFGYDPSRPVLQAVSFRIPAGASVGLVGSSGEGKSTLLALLLRLYDPQQGRILFDGVDIRQLKLGSYREQLATVLQEPFLFGVSVAENIRAGRPDASDDEVRSAARAAEAEPFIEQLGAGYDSELGERGTSLSRGQQQRIAIARAYVRRAPVLVFDEPTTGLDPATAREVRTTLLALASGKTCVWIAHDLAQIQDLPRALVLAGGRVVQDGKPAELLARAGAFRNLFGEVAS